jgi:hypothetical protein
VRASSYRRKLSPFSSEAEGFASVRLTAQKARVYVCHEGNFSVNFTTYRIIPFIIENSCGSC